MLLAKQGGQEGETYENVKEQKALEMEDRRKYIEEKARKKRQLRQLHIQHRETAKTESLQRAKEVSDRKVRQNERTQRLAEELARRKHNELQESLKSRKVKSAASSLSNQHFKSIEAELIERKGQDKELESSKDFDAWHFSTDSDTMLHEKKLSYKKDLQEQLIDNRRRLREKEEEKHRERKLMEEVGEAMHKENLEAEKRKKEMIALLQAERDAFLKARQVWKEKRREVLKQEFDEIARIVAKREASHKSEVERKSDVHAAKDAMVERMANKLMEEERKKVEREEICRELYVAQQESEFAQDEVKDSLKKKRTARELLQDMARHQKAAAERKAKENAIDAAFAKYIADVRKKQEEKEKQKEDARREKFMRYGKELRETIMKNCVLRAKEADQIKFGMDAKNDRKPKMKCYSELTFDMLKSQEANKRL